ncbi:MAG: arginine--tRNA ligase [Candidatus Ureaplasma intestinipullorum]|uniref:Arginine--tRNA ligase n=1 Tax=Candidatus Ureaplasma intestinipullorum TaxID=2838770 RepID=A0A9E2KWJ2_9BACT|nr:arginine--tRNA ligase [Candidatus Ureaplasma intestinipullorum]
MNKKIQDLIEQSLQILSYPEVKFNVEKTKSIKFGDYSSNVALMLKKIKPWGELKTPIQIAEEIASNINPKMFSKIEVVPPGFINFYLNDVITKELFDCIHSQKEKYPIFEKVDQVYNVEYVSANPTGYLHIGHARNAVFGDVLAKLLSKIGINVITEYVVNDAGNQMNILASSVLVRYKELFGQNITLPDDSYHGLEIIEVAKELKNKFNDAFLNVEINNDFIITNSDVRETIRNFSRDFLLEIIKNDLASLGVHIDIYYSEQEIHKNNLIPVTLEKLGNNVYEKDGAIWLQTTKFGDDKDRVLIKSDKTPTYFMPDIAYHDIKLNRPPKPNKLINVWGADHYSYITRMKIALKSLGYSDDVMEVISMQMVRLMKDGSEFKMSKRSGQSLTLKDLVNTLGKDVSRWFMISTSASTHIELDVDLALKQDNNNPIYYIEYAHARCFSILEKTNFSYKIGQDNFSRLTLEIEKELIGNLMNFQNIIYNAATTYEPHKIANYVYSLAKLFHSYYGLVMINDQNNIELTNQRLSLVSAVKIILENALSLLGIEAYDKM